jgi:hypothetical protein
MQGYSNGATVEIAMDSSVEEDLGEAINKSIQPFPNLQLIPLNNLGHIMNNVKEQLVALSELDAQIALLQQQRKDMEKAIKEATEVGEIIRGGRYQSLWKPGRKSTDHEQAAKAVNVPADIVEKHSTVKVTIQWAKVTKDAKIPKEILAQYTTESDPVFAIEEVKD